MQAGTESLARRVIRLRLISSWVIGSLSLACYNWWVGVALARRGLLSSPDELFSDLEATGRPYAALFSDLDVAAGVLLVVALALRGRFGPSGPRREWWLLIVFAVAGAGGGLFPYVCAEAINAACRSAQWHLHLPWRQYLHMVAGVVEFASATAAVALAWRRTVDHPGGVRRVVRGLGPVLALSYPLLAVSYLTDRLGAVVEPIFFVCFSIMAAVELVEAPRPPVMPAG